MAKEVEKPKEPTGTPPAEAPKVEKVDEKTGAPEAQAPESQASEEELVKMKSELGRLKQELGDKRKEAEELAARNLYYEQQQRQAQQAQQQQQITPEKINEMWFDNPAQMAQMQYNAITGSVATQMASQAKFIAKMQNPGAFEGIDENELDQAMFGGVQSKIVNPQTLADPNAWVGTAWILRGRQTGYTIPSTGPQNLNPIETERPGSPANPDVDDDEIPQIEGDDATQAMIESAARHGVTKEELAKRIHERREREKR